MGCRVAAGAVIWGMLGAILGLLLCSGGAAAVKPGDGASAEATLPAGPSAIEGASKDLPHRVFILHSYEKDHVCGQPQHDGVMAELEKARLGEGGGIETTVYYMDTKRKNNTPELIEEQGRLALEAIRRFRPHVLVTLDDDAFSAVGLKLVDSSVSIVFSGMNAQPEDYNGSVPFMLSRAHPGHNVTGVYEKLHIADAIRVHSKLFPDVKKVRIFVDSSGTGMALQRQIYLELEGEPVPCLWDVVRTESWEEYRAEILAANADPEVGAVYPAALLLKDAQGKTYTAPEILCWTVENSWKPEMALNYSFTKMGLFGGAAVDFHAMGRQAGCMVVNILNGQHPGEIPLGEAASYALVFNLKRARQLGIEIPSDILMSADEVVIE